MVDVVVLSMRLVDHGDDMSIPDTCELMALAEDGIFAPLKYLLLTSPTLGPATFDYVGLSSPCQVLGFCHVSV